MAYEKTPWWRRIFPPRTDFRALLLEQAGFTQEAVAALHAWTNSQAEGDLDAVVRIELESDEARQRLAHALAQAYETPLDREDINDLSRRLDDIVDAVRSVERKIRILRATPDDFLRRMLANIGGGLDHLRAAIEALPRNLPAAWKMADQARHSQRLTEELDAEGLSRLLDLDDHKAIFRQREVYHDILTVGKRLEATGEDMLHAINKLG